MTIRRMKAWITREATADLTAVLDDTQSGRLVEEHIDGISFGLWTLVAVLVLAGTAGIVLRDYWQ